MKKVLLTHSYFLRFDPKQWKMQQAYPPLGTLYAAAKLREQGYEVKVFDPMFEKSPEAILPVMAAFEPNVLVIYDDGFNYLTKMCLTNMRDAAFKMISYANLHKVVSIVSSSDSTDHTQDYLDHGANFIIRGEGEITLSELIRNLDTDQIEYNKIPGIAFWENGQTVITPKREVLRDLDTLPPPAWDLISMKEYSDRWKKSSGYFSLNLSTTRGCPFHCNWCAKPIYGNRYNIHSPAYIIREIKKLIELYNVHHFWMTDDIFGLKPGWVKEFADLIEKEKLSIRFKIQSRVDLLTTENTIHHLARAGCEIVWMGAESGSQKILDAMDKGTRIEQIVEATHLLKKNSIQPAFFLQFGYPGETLDDIRATLKMVEDLEPADIGISVSYPLPGTVFYERVKNELGTKTNWTDSDELAMMFKSPFPGEFYKNLQRYVHRSFRARQGKAILKDFVKHPGKASLSDLKRGFALPYHLAGKAFNYSQLKKFVKEGEVL